jgi:hypothetical protein
LIINSVAIATAMIIAIAEPTKYISTGDGATATGSGDGIGAVPITANDVSACAG